MRFQIGQNALDVDMELGQCRFRHHRWDKLGVQKLLDEKGNAIFINRHNVIVNIYSVDAGQQVNEIEVPQCTQERTWRRMTFREQAELDRGEKERREQLQNAWDDVVESLPDPDQLEKSQINAVNEARWPLEFSIVGLDDYHDDEGANALADAQSAVDEIKRLIPGANVTSLLKLISMVALIK